MSRSWIAGNFITEAQVLGLPPLLNIFFGSSIAITPSKEQGKFGKCYLAIGLWAQGRNMWVSQNMGLLWRWWKCRVGTYSTVSPWKIPQPNIKNCNKALILKLLWEQLSVSNLLEEGLNVAVEPGLVPESHPGREANLIVEVLAQLLAITEVTKRCRLSLLTNSVLVYEPKCTKWGGGGESCGITAKWANGYSCAHGAQINFGDLTPYLTYSYNQFQNGLWFLLIIFTTFRVHFFIYVKK